MTTSRTENIMTTSDTIQNYEKFFDLYAKLPKIFAIITAGIGVILAHVLGIMMKSFGIWFACIAGGAAGAAGAWFFTSLLASPTVLKVIYLKQIKESNKHIADKVSVKKEDDLISKLPNI